MALKRNVTVQGLPEFEKALDALPNAVAKKVLEGALRSGAGVIRRQAKALAPVGEKGLIRRALKVRKVRITRSRVIRAAYVVTADPRIAPHAHLIELGTRPRTTKAGAFRGKVKRRRFLERAFENNSSAVLSKIAQRLTAGIEREAAKLGPR